MSDREKETEGEKPDEAEASSESEKDEERDGKSADASASDAADTDSTPSDSAPSDSAPSDQGTKRDDESEDDDETDEDEGRDRKEVSGDSSAAESRSSSTALLIGVLCLAAGFGIGWFGHDFQMSKAEKEADAAVEGKGEAARGPCKDWEDAICGALGPTAYACSQAKSASTLLSGSACAQAQEGVTAKVDEIQAERAQCTELSTKLCSELGADGEACNLVKTQTPSFPPERCEQMMQNYDQVLAQLKMMQERGAMPGQRPPGHPGMNRGGPPPGAARPPEPSSQPPAAPAPAPAPAAP